MITFKILGEPETATAQQKGIKVKRSRTGKYYPKFYEKPEVKAAKQRLYFSLADYVPEAPIQGPIELSVSWLFPRKSKPKSYIGKYKDTSPDCDNLSKIYLDCMTDMGFWNSDGQVSRVHYTKMWVDDSEACTLISILPLTDQGADNVKFYFWRQENRENNRTNKEIRSRSDPDRSLGQG